MHRLRRTEAVWLPLMMGEVGLCDPLGSLAGHERRRSN